MGGEAGMIGPRHSSISFYSSSLDMQLFIVTASILATFNIERALSDDGKPIAPNEEYSLGFIR